MTLTRTVTDREDPSSEEEEIVVKRPRKHRYVDNGSDMDTSSQVDEEEEEGDLMESVSDIEGEGDEDAVEALRVQQAMREDEEDERRVTARLTGFTSPSDRPRRAAANEDDMDMLGSQFSSASISPVARVPDPRPRARWLSVKDVVETMDGLDQRVVRRLRFDEQVVEMDGKEVRIAMMKRCKSTTGPSWEALAEALELDWPTFLDQHYMVATLYEYTNKDGKKVKASAMLCYFFGDAGVEAGRAALCDLLRVSTRKDKPASLAEYVPPCYPVAAYIDIDQYHSTGLEDTGKLEKAVLDTFARKWRDHVRKVFITDKERLKAPFAVARASRAEDLGATFKCSMHIHDPCIVFDKPNTLRRFVEWFVRGHGGAIPSNKRGAPSGASGIDTSVYNDHGLFRLPLTVKFGGGDSTLLRVTDRGRLDDYLIVRPGAADNVITLQMLRDRIPKFGKDPRSSMVIPVAPRGSDGEVGSAMAECLNNHFRLPPDDPWRREPWAQEPGAVVLKYGGRRCVSSGEIHSAPWHSGVIYYPQSGEIYLTCANRAHSRVELDQFLVPVIGLPDTEDKADKEETGRGLREVFGAVYGRCPENLVTGKKALVLSALLSDKAKWYVVVIKRGFHVKLLCEDGRVIEILIVKLDKKNGLIDDQNRMLSVFLRDADGSVTEFDPEDSRILTLLFIGEVRLYGRPLARIASHLDRVNLYVHQVFKTNGFCRDKGVIYTKRATNRVLLEAFGGVDLDGGEDMLQRFVETICMSPSAPENVQAGWIALTKNQNDQAVEKVRALEHTYPKARWRNCVAFDNGILDLPMNRDVDLDTLRAGFIAWADLPEDTEPFIPRLEVSGCNYDPDFFTNPEHTPATNYIIGYQFDPDNPMHDAFIAYCGRMHVAKVWYVERVLTNDGWGHCVVMGESGTGKSTILKGILSVFQPEKRHVVSQARAGKLGAYKMFPGKDVIYLDECSTDPDDDLYKKLNMEFFEMTARRLEVEIDDIYKTNNKTVIISAPMIFACNGRQFGFEHKARSEAQYEAINRSAAWFNFDKKVEMVDTSLETRVMQERGAFLCRSLWTYICKLKEWGTDLRTQPFFNCHLKDRLHRYHPYARYLSFCLAHPRGVGLSEDKEYHILTKSIGGGLHCVNKEDLMESFGKWLGVRHSSEYKPDECKGIFNHFGFKLVDKETWMCKSCSNPVHGIVLIGTGNCGHKGAQHRGTKVRQGYVINATIVKYGGVARAGGNSFY